MAPVALAGVSHEQAMLRDGGVRVQWKPQLGRDVAGGRIGYLDDAIGAGRIQVGAVEAVGEGAAAALVSPRLPGRFYTANASLAGERVGVNMARRQAYRHDGLLRVDGLGKDIVVKRNGTYVLEHGAVADARHA